MQDTNNTKLSDKQELFLEYLFNDPEIDGCPRKAGEKAGYDGFYASNGLVKSLADEILKRANHKLSMSAPKAVNRLINAMDEDGTIPKGDIRLKAVESILDRVGLSKKQEMTISMSDDSPLFFIPSKAITSSED